MVLLHFFLILLFCYGCASTTKLDVQNLALDEMKVANILSMQQKHSGRAVLLQRVLEISGNTELASLLRSLVGRLEGDLNCLALVSDPLHQEVFGPAFYQRLGTVPVFKVLVQENEDLLSPKYRTLKAIRQVRKDGCRAYFLLFANGIQLGRFLRFGDAHRVLDTRARFVLLYDRRVLTPDLHYLWKKIVNVIFLRRYGGPWTAGSASGKRGTIWFELSTVPFPAPIRGVLVPRRLDIWRRGSFRQSVDLFRDKTSNLQNQTLPVVTFPHVPASYKVLSQQSDKNVFDGLEVQMVRALADAMNFVPSIYEPSQAEREQWGHRQLDGSLSGLLGEATSGRAELVLGDLHYTPYHLGLLDLSVPYYVQCLTFLTPEATTDNSWQTLILPFTSYMWLAVGLALAIGGSVFYALAKSHSHLEELMDLELIVPFPEETSQPNVEQTTKGVHWRALASLASHAGAGLRRLSRIPRPRLPRLPRLPRPSRPHLFRFNLRRRRGRELPVSEETDLHDVEQVLDEEVTAGPGCTDPVEPQRYDVAARPTRRPRLREQDKTALHLFADSPGSALLYTWGMLLGVSLHRIPSGWAVRVMTGWWWLYGILVVVAYRAALTAILANPMPKITIDTLEQLADSSLAVGGWGEHVKEFFQTSLDAAGQKVGQKFEVTENWQAAVERVAQGSFAYYENTNFLRYAAEFRRRKIRASNSKSTVENETIISQGIDVPISNRDGTSSFASGGSNSVTNATLLPSSDANVDSGSMTNSNRSDNSDTSSDEVLQERNLHIMRDCVINMPISLGLQKNSALKPRVDRFLRRVIEAGLVHKWLTDTVLATTAAAGRGRQEEASVKAVMNLKKMYGALVALLAGYLIASLAFLGELVLYRGILMRRPTFDMYAKNRGLVESHWHQHNKSTLR